MSLDNTIENFKAYLERKNAFSRAGGLYGWDMQTANPPAAGMPYRAKTMAILAEEEFKMSISEEMKSYLTELEAHFDSLSDDVKAMHRICKKQYYDNINIPAEEARAFEELKVKGYEVWRNAKINNDFKSFSPYLKQLVDYQKKFVAYRDDSVNTDNIYHAYDSLLADYEPGLTCKDLDVFFAKIREAIVPLLKDVVASGNVIDTSFLNRPVSLEKQKRIARLIMDTLGFDFDKGLLAETEHPFCGAIAHNDVRITTHYYENNFLSSLFSVAHESGHAIYDQNVSEAYADTVVDNGTSFGIHESQSRFFENVICRSLEFWQYIYDDIMEILGDDFKDITAEQFYRAANVAQPSLIRIEADELTYSLHIMIRYEVEKLLFSGDIDVNDLPALWNEKMKEYLGIEPADDKTGILQDVHWSYSSFGYFPSYSVGSAYAAQLLAYMEKDMDVYGNIRNGNIAAIKSWLTDKIHKYGALYEPEQLISMINGEKLNADYYVAYLRKKFS